MAQIRKTTCAIIMFVLVIVASPFSAFAVPLCFSICPMNTGHESCEAMANCMGNCLMLAQINPTTRQKSHPQSSANQPSSCPCRNASQPSTQETITQSVIGINNRVSGIRRIYPKNVLDHPQRNEIYNLIVANPGIDLGRIGITLNLNRETLRYHIDLLTSSNKIVVMKDHGIIRFYENHGRYGVLERRVLAHLWNPTAEQILSIVQSNPGITQGDIAARLSLASPSVHWYMQRLSDDGIVKSQRTGRLTNYSITEKAFQVLTNSVGVRQCVQAETCAQ
jgi:predicted transcriptional regulator